MIMGIDISAYETAFTKVPDPAEFVIIKATEGRTWSNRYLVQQVTVARTAGKQIGWYHWLHKGNVAAQIAWFLKTIAPHLQPGDILVIDYEQCMPKNPDPTEADLIAAIAETQRLKPTHMVLAYMNLDWWRTRNKSKTKGDGLWLAHYTEADKPGADDWLIWQFKEKPDWNQAQFDSLAAMNAWALSKEPPPPTALRVGQRFRTTAADGLHARTGPALGDATATGRFVDKGYNVDIEKVEWSPLDRMWFARGDEFWYSADYLERVPPTEYLVDVNPGSVLRARSAPSANSKVLAERARGYVVRAERIVNDTSGAKGDDGKPRRWAVNQTGEHYAMEYLQKAS